jgi:hypothetical protein
MKMPNHDLDRDEYLLKKVTGLRACLRSSEQQSEEGQVDHLHAGIEFAFAVFP